MKTRKPYVAGRFYEGEAAALTKQIENIYIKEKEEIDFSLVSKKIIGGIVPHAGYMFSAYQAIHYFKILAESNRIPEIFIIINPNHSGLGLSIALDKNDFWETPFGKVEIDQEFNDELGFQKDSNAHAYEHSGEVMLPLLQYFIKKTFKIVPITLTKQTPETAELLATSIYETNKKLNRKINIIASSDFSHYVSPTEGKLVDDFAVEQILNLDARKLYDIILQEKITACGYGPIMALIYYSNLLSREAKSVVLKRGHSGEVIPSSEVVHYISFLFYENN